MSINHVKIQIIIIIFLAFVCVYYSVYDDYDSCNPALHCFLFTHSTDQKQKEKKRQFMCSCLLKDSS